MSHLLKTQQHEQALRLDGPISGEEGAHLAYLASQIPAGGIVVEIGTNEGKSAAFMAFGLLHARNAMAQVHCVDLWSLGGETQQVNYRGPHKHGRFLRNMERLELHNVTGHMAESTAFAANWRQPIDLLFIDAGHSYDAVRADYEAWSGFVKPGGFIAFHDYMPMWPGVMKLLDETVMRDPKWGEWQQVDRMMSARLK